MSTRKLVFLSIMISLSIVLSIVESAVSSFFFTIPGMKLGFANIATMVVVFSLDRKSGLIVAFLRIFLVGLIYTGLFTPGFWISLSGGTLSVFVLISLKGTNLSIYTISVVSALMHMVGQIAATIVVVKTPALIYYLPYMILLSIPAGFITGYLSKKIISDFSEKIISFK
ncbi:MAG: Gx transporter family protein [Tenericutes bacterium]|nr:Gx transporter family protein [Mycoplasmatota bacterium]